MPALAFGGGCHWCTEAVFDALRGTTVTQGFAASEPPYDSPSEAALVVFDDALMPLDVLVEVHLRTHASTSRHAMRGKYRSAIYWRSEAMAAPVREAVARAADLIGAGPVVTQVLKLAAFEASPPEYQRYYATRGAEAPFCRTYIDPKLALLRQRFGRYASGA